MKDLKGTKTEKNLWEAFAGESQARNKYTYFASKAKKDGYVQIAKIFEETAANEKSYFFICNSFLIVIFYGYIVFTYTRVKSHSLPTLYTRYTYI